mmetsp:Transcript_64129/g.144647  ORF Transcript_64129/g.144647 Transcript_64129/m.144647 type:complete len:272 (-) Transcript_64129:44-859(-)
MRSSSSSATGMQWRWIVVGSAKPNRSGDTTFSTRNDGTAKACASFSASSGDAPASAPGALGPSVPRPLPARRNVRKSAMGATFAPAPLRVTGTGSTPAPEPDEGPEDGPASGADEGRGPKRVLAAICFSAAPGLISSNWTDTNCSSRSRHRLTASVKLSAAWTGMPPTPLIRHCSATTSKGPPASPSTEAAAPPESAAWARVEVARALAQAARSIGSAWPPTSDSSRSSPKLRPSLAESSSLRDTLSGAREPPSPRQALFWRTQDQKKSAS